MFFVQNMNLMCFCGLSRANILLSYYRFPNLFSEALRKSKPTENQLAWQAEGRPKSGRSSVAEVQWIPPSRLWWAASSNAKVASCKCWMPWGESCQTWEVRMYEWSITHLRLGGGFLAPTAPHRGKTMCEWTHDSCACFSGCIAGQVCLSGSMPAADTRFFGTRRYPTQIFLCPYDWHGCGRGVGNGGKAWSGRTVSERTAR